MNLFCLQILIISSSDLIKTQQEDIIKALTLC